MRLYDSLVGFDLNYVFELMCNTDSAETKKVHGKLMRKNLCVGKSTNTSTFVIYGELRSKT